ncbi:thioredoxin family protein [Candidatus Xianfuyuplasma coldseepsis]|uniref:Thioredoxin family protein n=1 Tax=Candidatus Xianfuyuplasma coldseepsis TaxID=2782163 RepID=A0A7L7KRG4_9MOLU|nr:thioredoxin family protein [Xianfuyuplasma coldseepsis]QMS85411.1 thioredoxin family protein [Xianfuyuplasma coldseepsis]
MKEIKTLKQFYDVIENEPNVLVYWYTKWCPDCFATKPHLPRLENEFSTIEFYSMDRDVDINLAKHLEIFGIPSFLYFENGEEVGRYVDKKRKSYDQIKAFINDAQTK